jgi:hypothetical protein
MAGKSSRQRPLGLAHAAHEHGVDVLHEPVLIRGTHYHAVDDAIGPPNRSSLWYPSAPARWLQYTGSVSDSSERCQPERTTDEKPDNEPADRQAPPAIRPVAKKIGEGDDNLKRRSEWFRRRTSDRNQD